MTASIPPFDRIEYETRNAYHGTTVGDARSIWASKRFLEPSKRVEDSRFGPGVYFWENSPRAAKNWVRIYYRTDDFGVIRATIKCRSLLDLLTVEHFQVLESTRLKIAQRFGKPVAGIRHSAVLSFLWTAKAIDGARLITGVTPNTNLNPESKLAGPFEVMLCVYDTGNIVVSEFRDRSSP